VAARKSNGPQMAQMTQMMRNDPQIPAHFWPIARAAVAARKSNGPQMAQMAQMPARDDPQISGPFPADCSGSCGPLRAGRHLSGNL
jgi:hypothetical protein